MRDLPGMQYFVGEFDGDRFIADHPVETPEWLEYGKDFYAAITYNNLPEGHHLYCLDGPITGRMPIHFPLPPGEG